jgi:myosin-crossreactive antigen
MTLKDSPCVLSLSVFHQREIIDQPSSMNLWWGYGLYPGEIGEFVKKRSLQEALSDFEAYSQLVPSDPDGPKSVERVKKELSAR